MLDCTLEMTSREVDNRLIARVGRARQPATTITLEPALVTQITRLLQTFFLFQQILLLTFS